MGREKGLTKLAGVPMVRRVAEVLQEVTDELVVSVGPGKAEEYAHALGDLARVVEDPEQGLGPLQGIVTALSAAKEGLVIVAPCDTPFIMSSICSLIISSVGSRDGAVPRIGPYFEPLHGCFSRGCLGAFKTALTEGKRKPIDAFGGLDIATVPEERLRGLDPQMRSFWSLNSPKELAEAERLLADERFRIT